jgi:hypothetical protein
MPSVSKKQHNFMNAIAHNKAFAKKVGIPQSVGKDFAEADKGKKFKQGGAAMGLNKLFRGKEGKTEEMREAKALRMGAITPKEFIKGEKSEGHKEENSAAIAKKIKSGKMSPAAYAKMESEEKYGHGGKVKKMAVGGATGSFNSTGSNPYAPQMQTGAIGGLDQLNQSIGAIQNALGGKAPNVGESTQMYREGGKVNTKKMAMGGAPVDPRAAAMAAKRAAMGSKRGMPIAGRAAPQMAGMAQGKPMVGRMPPQAGMPMPTMKKGGVAKKVTKEMEYDYKTGKKSFAGTTAQRDAHAEKEGKRVAKDLAFDMSKGMKKGGMAECKTIAKKEVKGHEKRMHKMARGGGIEVKGKTKGKMIKMAAGGSVGSASKRADGCAVRGKTKA